MKNELLQDKLKIEKAKKEDWDEILILLEETNLIDRVSGNGNYENFYSVKIQDKIICCFAIFYKDNIGILKSFGIKKDLQGQGIGKKIVNKLPELIKSIGLNKLYAASWEAPEFWEKAGFQEINFNESKDDYFLKYSDYLEKNYPQFAKTRKYFILRLI
jgi:N-acetylglutamate synthase-like GNAT family acetyltransferase